MGPILDNNKGLVPAVVNRNNYMVTDLMVPPNAIQVTNLDDLFTRLWRRRNVLAVFIVVGTIGALALASFQKPMYRSIALVEVQGLNDNILNTRDVDPTASTLNYPMDSYVQTQIKIVKSESVVGKAADRLKLEDHPELLYSEGLLQRLKRSLGLAAPLRKTLTQQQAIDWGSSHLTVRIPGLTRMIEISVEAADPKLAANFANAIVDEYIDSTVGMHSASSERTTAWLGEQIAELRSKVQRSEADLQAYAQKTGLLFTAEKDNIAEVRLRQLQDSLSKAHELRVAQQSRYDLVATAPADSLPEVLDDPVLREYQARLTELRRQLAELQPVLAPGHYKVQQIQSQITEMEGAMDGKRANILSRIKNEFDAAEHEEKILAGNYAAQVQLVSGQSVNAIQYDILKRELDTNRQMYESMLQKQRGVRMAAAMHASDISIVDNAKPAKMPFRPNRAVFAATGLGFSTFAGMAFVLFPRRRRARVDPPSGVIRQLGIPELGSIPFVQSKGKKSTLELNWSMSQQDTVAEAFRATMVSILLGSRGAYDGQYPRVIVISSCAHGDGRTTVAANLAIALTEADHKVLLVDADLRKPRLHDLFRLDNRQGLSSILLDTKPCESYTAQQLGYSTNVPRLHVLPSGPASEGTAGLLHSARTAEFLDKVRSVFDIVIIDTPPVLPFADGRTLAKLSDGVAFVIRADETTPDDLLSALQRFAEDGAPVLGSIVNGREKTKASVYEEAPSKSHSSVPLVPSFLEARVSTGSQRSVGVSATE
ncbi:MAG: polysaccharide biosynthesis tyrosine autokinase [Acidobacteriota bacterium]|nr:polysaccharide biosynthesis tyrosine autokinase [Acidobacteriota bacterium]